MVVCGGQASLWAIQYDKASCPHNQIPLIQGELPSYKRVLQKLKISLLPNKLLMKGGEGYQDVNNSLVGCSLVHSRTIGDADADAHKPELICYDLYLSLCLCLLAHMCLVSYSKPIRLRSSNVWLQRRLVQFQFFFGCLCEETRFYSENRLLKRRRVGHCRRGSEQQI